MVLFINTRCRHLSIICYMYFFSGWMRLQLYWKGDYSSIWRVFFRGDLYIWSTSILYFFFVFICLLIIHYRREYTRYGSDTRGFAPSNLKRKLWPLDYKYLNVWVWPLDCSYKVWSLKGRRQSLKPFFLI